MLEYSGAVILEGDNPAGYADLEGFVAPALVPDETLYRTSPRDIVALQRAKAEAWAELLRQPDGMVTWMEDVMGLPLGDLLRVRSNPRLTEDVRSRMLEGIAQVRAAPPPRPVDYWAVAERFQGIERAGLVVVNLGDHAAQPAAEQLLVEPARLRRDAALFNDIVGLRGNRLPTTAVVANLADPRNAARKKAVARVRRAIRSQVRSNAGRWLRVAHTSLFEVVQEFGCEPRALQTYGPSRF